MDKSVPRVTVWHHKALEVRMDKSVPRVTVWHHEALPSDAKQ